MGSYDFSGWATRNDLTCSDGRTIRRDAFKDNDGCRVPLVWNHEHNDPNAVLGHAMLENRDDGVYAYGKFNDTEQGQHAKKLLQNGDIRSLSIWANQLKQIGSDVMHENIMLYHSDESKGKKGETDMVDNNKESGKTIQEIIDSMTDEQQEVMYAMVGQALEENDIPDDNGDEEEDEMKHNVFDKEEMQQSNVLSHSDEEAIISLAKQSGIGNLKSAMEIYAEENFGDTLAHGVFTDADTEKLFPEYELLKKGEPETLERDQSWITAAISKIHKSPYSRIRTRQADARIAELKAKGYQKKGNYKQNMADIKMISRTTDPQTVYIKDDMHRDDVNDITDFDVVVYQWNLMRHILNETLAMAALVGDGREEGDPDKIHEDHIRSIWHDDELYCIHQDVDFEAAKTKLQGTNTGANFSENYIKAEAMIEAALYSREKFKGSGTPDLYCTPHLLNVMLLARDLNGRRIYDSKSDLAAALNVGEIHTVEQFEGLQREDSTGKKHKMLGLFVNLADYQFGSTKGGEVTKFEDFDMDFNRYKYMLETRLSGSLIKLYSAIALEEPVA